MSSTRIIGAALLLVGVVACTDAPAESIAGPGGEPSLSGGREGVPNASALGFVKVNKFGYFDTYSFAATSRRGVVIGAFQWRSVQPSGEISQGSGRVVCLTVVGNVAHLGGELQPDDLYWAPPPFNHVVWTVVDNHWLPNKAPDLASLVIAFKTREQVEAHCRTGGLALAPLDRGDVIVHGGVQVDPTAAVNP